MSGVGRMLQRRSLLELADVDIVMLTLAADAVEAVGREVVGGEDAPHALAEDVLHAAASGMTDEGSADGRSGAGSSGAFTSKTAPGVVFATRQELADHNRSDWHRLNIKRLAAGLDPVTEEESQRIVSDLEDGASLSGSDSEASEDGDGDGDDDEFRNIIEAQATLDIREKERRLNRLTEHGDEGGGHKLRGALVPVKLEGEGEDEEAQRWGVYRQVLQGGWEDEGAGASVGAALLALKHGKISYLFASGGHFAGAVYQGHTCVQHKTFHRYVIRAKAGTRQATRDAMGGSSVPKSAGSSLRRHNEQLLAQEIAGLLHSWKTELDESERIFVHAPGIVNRNSIFIKGVLSRGDARVRSVPFNTRRPTGKEVARVHHQLLALHPLQHLPPKKSVSLPPDAHSDPARGTGGKGDAAAEADALREVEGSRSEDAIFGCVSKANMPGIKLLVAEGADVNVAEGKQGRTPLHRAAAAGPPRLISFLLDLGADPTLGDNAGKMPYELCKEKDCRDAFRRFWAAHPDKWDYSRAGIPSMLSADVEAEQQQRAADKKEKERLRRKEQERRKKENERVAREAREAQAVAAQAESQLTERERRALAAERRLGVAPTAFPAFSCAMCKAEVRRMPFERLGHKYCSTQCVVAHKAVLGN